MSRPAKPKNTRSRLNIEVSTGYREIIEELRDETGADSLSEVVRKALDAYQTLRSYRDMHGTIFIGVYRSDLPDGVKTLWVLP